MPAVLATDNPTPSGTTFSGYNFEPQECCDFSGFGDVPTYDSHLEDLLLRIL